MGWFFPIKKTKSNHQVLSRVTCKNAEYPQLRAFNPLKNQAPNTIRKMHLAKLLWKQIQSPRLALSKGYSYHITARTARCRRETHVSMNSGA